MQSDQQQLGQNAKFPLADQVGSGYIRNRPIGSFFGQNVDFQPSKICPRNFVIFDWTNNHSQIMYHPTAAPNFGYPDAAYIDNNMIVQKDENAHKEVFKEDSADIDLLLSFEEEEEDEYVEEEVSTARTRGNDATDTADSCSSRPRNRKSKLGLSSSYSHKSSETKRGKIRKMVNSLRGIVPGGNHMNTIAVIDEAVKYLKSLKVELQKADVGI